MRAPEIYKGLVADVSEYLKSKGFKKKGNWHYQKADKNWALISLVKDRGSSQSRVIYTVSFAVVSERVRDFYYPEDVGKWPSIGQATWYVPLGYLLPPREDKWWVLYNLESLSQHSEELLDVLKSHVLPALQEHLTDESLLTSHLGGEVVWTTDVRRNINIAILALHLGKRAVYKTALRAISDDSVGTPWEKFSAEKVSRLVELELHLSHQ